MVLSMFEIQYNSILLFENTFGAVTNFTIKIKEKTSALWLNRISRTALQGSIGKDFENKEIIYYDIICTLELDTLCSAGQENPSRCRSFNLISKIRILKKKDYLIPICLPKLLKTNNIITQNNGKLDRKTFAHYH